MKTNAIDRLVKLNELRSSGALTDDEFEEEKRKLLAEKSPRWPIFAGIGIAGITIFALASTWLPHKSLPMRELSPPAQVFRSLPSPASSQSVARSIPAERLTNAFEAATGHRRVFSQMANGEKFTIKPMKIVDLPFGVALLVSREIKDGCHACSGFIGIYYLRADQDRFVVTASYPKAVSGWGWGAAPTAWQITNRFTANPAIYASGGYMGQGITVSSATITELQPSGPITSDLIGTGYSDAGAITDDNPRPVCRLNGKITHVIRDRSFDVAVSGTVSGKDQYIKKNGKFAAVSKRDWELPCPQDDR